MNIQELKRRRTFLTRQIAAERKRAAPQKKGKPFQHIIRKKYPSLSSSLDRAAKTMWG